MKKKFTNIKDDSPEFTFAERKGDRRKNKTNVVGEFFIRAVGDRKVFGKNRRKGDRRDELLIDTTGWTVRDVQIGDVEKDDTTWRII